MFHWQILYLKTGNSSTNLKDRNIYLIFIDLLLISIKSYEDSGLLPRGLNFMDDFHNLPPFHNFVC